jgi:stage V sporulation protein S
MVEIDGQDVTFFVSSTTNVAKLGSAIAHGVYAQKTVTLRAIGPGPISQAQKAIAVASGFTAPRGYDLASRPSFTTVTMPDRKEVTAMVFKVVVI